MRLSHLLGFLTEFQFWFDAERFGSGRYILRNHHLREVIQAAEDAEYAPLQELMAVLEQPYAEQPAMVRYDDPSRVEARREGVRQLS